MLSKNDIKYEFKIKFNDLLEKNIILKQVLFEIFIHGTAYIVGGYFRDFISEKQSRDIDIIVDLEHLSLVKLLNEFKLNYETNRHGGIKLKLEKFDVDLWSLENNWAFKNNLVKLNEEDKLNSIAKGCFYNYDALVINLHSFNYNMRYYNEFIVSHKLDILQKSPLYKILNPTLEANILRALYLKKIYKIDLTQNTKEYIISSLGNLKDRFGNYLDRIIEIKSKYSKYEILTKDEIFSLIEEIRNDNKINDQLKLDI